MDKDTQQVVRDGQTVADFVRSDGWQLVKAKLIAKIEEMNSVSNIDFNKPADQLALEVQTRANTVKLVFEWLRDIEGTAQQHEANQTTLTQIEEQIIVQYND